MTGGLTLHGPVLADGSELPPGRVEVREGTIRGIERGRFAHGYDADLVVLDADWRVTATVARGELVYAASTT